MYDYQMTELAQAGYRAIAIVLRGFGQSDKPYGAHNDDLKAEGHVDETVGKVEAAVGRISRKPSSGLNSRN